MAFARCHLVIQDLLGNIVNGATVTVRLESSGALAVPFSDRAGITGLGNPYVAADGSDAGFYASGNMYRIDAVLGAFSKTWRDVAVGTAGGTDVTAGTGSTREVNAAGDIVVGAADLEILVNKTVGANTNVILGKAADRAGVPITIVDLKGDADAHNITPVFDGVETCNGLAAANFKITTPGGLVTFKPRPDGTGWYLGPNHL